MLDEFKDLVDRVSWRPVQSAPKDGTFVLLYCAEDKSRWLASWQDCRWYGVDDLGLTRAGSSEGDPNVVTGWFITAWMPLPDPPSHLGEQADEHRRATECSASAWRVDRV